MAIGDRHLDGLATRRSARATSTSSARTSRGAAVPRRRGVVGGAAGALAGHASTTTAAPAATASPRGCARSPIPRTRRARPRARSARLKEMQAFQDGADRPYLHLVDGGLSDNLGMRAVLEGLEQHRGGTTPAIPTPLDRVTRIVVFVVNSLSVPQTDWDESEAPPNDARDPAQGDRRADRPLFLRVGRAVEGHDRALANDAAASAIRRRCAATRIPPSRSRCACRTSSSTPIDVSFAAAQGHGRARLPQRAADVVRAAGRGGRPPARRGGNDHPVDRPTSSGC